MLHGANVHTMAKRYEGWLLIFSENASIALP